MANDTVRRVAMGGTRHASRVMSGNEWSLSGEEWSGAVMDERGMFGSYLGPPRGGNNLRSGVVATLFVAVAPAIAIGQFKKSKGRGAQ